MSKNAMPMVFYAGKSAQLLGAPPQTPVFGGRGGFAPLTPTKMLECSVPGPSWGLSPQTPSVPLFSLLDVATLVDTNDSHGYQWTCDSHGYQWASVTHMDTSRHQ